MAMSILLSLTLLLALLPVMHGHAQLGEEVWLEHSVEPTQPYVGQQVLYTLRLYQGVSLDSVRLVAPASPLAEVRPLGEHDIQEAERNGQRYRLTEQRYAIFAFASGQTRLQGGRALVTRPGMSASADLRFDAPRFVLNVRPAASTQAPWLPTTALNLSESWNQPTSPAHVGAILQRQIRIEAFGAQAAQIPPLEIAGPGFTAHRLPPVLEDHLAVDGITGVREETWMIIPTSPGQLQVPPVAVDWFDTSRHLQARSNLPSRVLGIAPLLEQPAIDTALMTETLPSDAVATSSGMNESPAPPLLHFVFASLCGALLVLSLAGLILRHYNQRATLRALRAACRSNDPRAAHAAALAWCRQLVPNQPPNLSLLGRQFTESNLSCELAQLDRVRFGAATGWQGRNLLRALRRCRYARIDNGH